MPIQNRSVKKIFWVVGTWRRTHPAELTLGVVAPGEDPASGGQRH